ncbi:MAG TPA: PilN domain-containing protein [Gemmatimonadaceae bacterium]|nr:PilN domain-containing protein [Gemmatimonadaceae bacterium]
MITVNLLPGSAKKSTSRDFNISGMISGAASSISDKYLIACVGTVSATVLAVGFLFMGQGSRERTLVEREQRAIQDSARYKVVLEAKAKAEATRDSLYRQVAIIKSIDDSRYMWPHLLEEISNALPQYTWLTIVTQTSAPPSSAFQDTTKKAASKDGEAKKTEATAAQKKAHADSVLAEASRATKFRIVGHTVDIQALTLFMKTLEASPFIQNVQLTRSDMVLVDNKEVTEFQLEAETQKPPAFIVKTVAMNVGEN